MSEKANLGLATTRELLEEMAARIEVSKTINEEWLLDYSTVNGERGKTPMSDLKGYLVNFRIVKQSHDHRSITVFVSASDEVEAEKKARNDLQRAADGPGFDDRTNLGYVKVERLNRSDTERDDAPVYPHPDAPPVGRINGSDTDE